MANDNKTVKQVCDNMINFCTCGYLASLGNMEHFTSQIIAAHNREMNALAEQKTAEAHEAFVKNAELADTITEKDAEIARLRALVEGLLDAASIECSSCGYDCGPKRENCIIREALKYINEGDGNR